MTYVIGHWVARRTVTGRRTTRRHLVESAIAEEPVTRCGRRLGHIEGTAIGPAPYGELCAVCAAKP